jgi:hypothetical protein
MPVGKMHILEWIPKSCLFGKVKIEEVMQRGMKDASMETQSSVLKAELENMLSDALPSIGDYRLRMSPYVEQLGIVERVLCALSRTEIAKPYLWEPRFCNMIHSIFMETNVPKRLIQTIQLLSLIKQKEDYIIVHKYLLAEDTPKPAPSSSAEQKSTDPPDDDVKKYMKRVEGKKLPQLIQTRLEEELVRLQKMDRHSPENPMLRAYLDLLTGYPWGVLTTDTYDIEKAKAILSETHYGMDEVKQRILQLLAVGKLVGKMQGKILCFAGPPGVGKTSIGESIAK